MTEEKDTQVSRDLSRVVLLIIGIIALIGFIASVIAWAKVGAMQEQIDDIKTKPSLDAGTWVCINAAGSMTPVGNPANCAPGDEIKWCAVWDEASGTCVG